MKAASAFFNSRQTPLDPILGATKDCGKFKLVRNSSGFHIEPGRLVELSKTSPHKIVGYFGRQGGLTSFSIIDGDNYPNGVADGDNCWIDTGYLFDTRHLTCWKVNGTTASPRGSSIPVVYFDEIN